MYLSAVSAVVPAMLEIGPTRSGTQALDAGLSSRHTQTGRSPHKGPHPCPDSPESWPLQQRAQAHIHIHFNTIVT